MKYVLNYKLWSNNKHAEIYVYDDKKKTLTVKTVEVIIK